MASSAQLDRPRPPTKKPIYTAPHTIDSLMKVMLPVMVIVRIAQEFGAIDVASEMLTPVMALIGLPPEAGLIWATCALVSMYGAVGAFIGLAGTLDMTAAQLRAAIGYGALVTWISNATGWLSEPVDFSWMAGGDVASAATGLAGWGEWVIQTLKSLVVSFAVITGLLVILDAMKITGLTDKFTLAMLPILRVSGLSRDVAPVTTIGVLLGLTFGGALIIDEARRTLFLSLSWLSLSHSLIEDTAIMLALGADIWVILVGRVILTLIIIALLARLTLRWDRKPDQLATDTA